MLADGSLLEDVVIRPGFHGQNIHAIAAIYGLLLVAVGSGGSNLLPVPLYVHRIMYGNCIVEVVRRTHIDDILVNMIAALRILEGIVVNARLVDSARTDMEALARTDIDNMLLHLGGENGQCQHFHAVVAMYGQHMVLIGTRNIQVATAELIRQLVLTNRSFYGDAIGRPRLQVQGIGTVATLCGLMGIFVVAGLGQSLAVPEVGITLGHRVVLAEPVTRDTIDYHGAHAIATVGGNQHIAINTRHRNRRTVELKGLAVAEVDMLQPFVGLTYRQGHLIDRVHTQTGVEAVVINTRGEVVLAVPYKRQIALTGGVAGLHIEYGILVQGQLVDTVATRYGTQAVVIDTRLGIGIATPFVTTARIHLCVTLVQVTRRDIDRDAADAVATQGRTNGIPIYAGLGHNATVIQGQRLTRAYLGITRRVIDGMYGQGQTVDTIVAQTCRQAVVIDTGGIELTSVPVVGSIAIAYLGMLFLVVRRILAERQLVDGVATAHRAEAVEIDAVARQQFAVPCVHTVIIEVTLLTEVVTMRLVDNEHTGTVASPAGEVTISVHTRRSNQRTVPHECLPRTQLHLQIGHRVLMHRELQAIDAVGHRRGGIVVVVRAGTPYLSAAPRQRQIIDASLERLVDVMHCLLQQGQMVDTVAPRGGEETVEVLSGLREVASAPPILASVLGQTAGLVEKIHVTAVHDQRIDAVVAILGVHRIQVDAGLCDQMTAIVQCLIRTQCSVNSRTIDIGTCLCLGRHTQYHE